MRSTWWPRVAALALACAAPMLTAQAPADTIALAKRLRDAQRLDSAATVLRAYLANHPANGEAARLLSETLYWRKDVAGARAVAESSLVRHPEDTALRLQYARMLAETGDPARAGEVVQPALNGPDRPRALALLGTTAYWEGDWSEAARLFTAALAANPQLGDARTQLAEIRSATAPRVVALVAAQHDDQPITAVQPTLETMFYADPLTPITVRGSDEYFRLADTASRTLAAGELGVAHTIPGAHLRVGAGAGAVARSWGTSSDWIANAFVELRPAPSITLTATADRGVYVATEASLSTPVMVQRGTLDAALSTHTGWLGQFEAQVQQYPDANIVTAAYAWLMAPVARAGGNELHVGYSVAGQDSRELRYTLVGLYSPYYTPRGVLSHSAIAAMHVGSDHGLSLDVNGGYAIYATENAPVVRQVQASPRAPASTQLTEAAQTFHPWNVRATLGSPLTVRWHWAATGEAMHTAFYSAQTATLQLQYRLRD